MLSKGGNIHGGPEVGKPIQKKAINKIRPLRNVEITFFFPHTPLLLVVSLWHPPEGMWCIIITNPPPDCSVIKVSSSETWPHLIAVWLVRKHTHSLSKYWRGERWSRATTVGTAETPGSPLSVLRPLNTTFSWPACPAGYLVPSISS